MHESAVTRYLVSLPALDILGDNCRGSTPTPGRSPMNDVVTMAYVTSPPSTPDSASVPVIAKHSFPPFLLTRTYGLVSRMHLRSIFCRENGLELVELIPGLYEQRLAVAKEVLEDVRALVETGTDFRKHLMMQGVISSYIWCYSSY